MLNRLSFIIAVFLALCAFTGLILCPEVSAAGARAGLMLCSGIIIPALFPLSVAGNIFLELGLPGRLSKVFSPAMKRLFGVSGAGTAAFFLGIAGGYPLGAMAVSEMYAKRLLQKKEAERLLGFCDNSGPAFVVSVAGGAVFGSVRLGFFLYAAHIFSAVLTGMLLNGGRAGESAAPPVRRVSLSAAFSDSVRRSTAA
ncbi:MAG: sporulation protein, partial [Oscillospiraceae bacterium]|nr:sporulation protein [Oscillospiraceae bacterium]